MFVHSPGAFQCLLTNKFPIFRYIFSDSQTVVSKVGYVKFQETVSVGVALHLTNTVFIDRALIVVAVNDGRSKKSIKLSIFQNIGRICYSIF